jgi:RNA polymerase primary sigma factor
MHGIILTPRGSPVPRRRTDLDRVNVFPRWETKGLEDLGQPVTGLPPGRQTEREPAPVLRIFAPNSRKSRKDNIERARRLLAAKLTYIAHPSFDDPSARDAIQSDGPEFDTAALDRALSSGDPDAVRSPDSRIPSREQEGHVFRKMNYLKCLACRIGDRIDPDSPAPVDLDEVERLQTEALRLKNQIVETHLPLVVSIAKRRVTPGDDLSDRISDGNFALMEAVERFDFARGFRFSTYATWAIINELTRRDRKEWCRRKRSVPLTYHPLAAPDIESEQNEVRDKYRMAVERLLGRLDRRERWVMVNRHGIGGVPEQTLKQIGLELGISKERVRQLKERALAKLRNFARLEAIEPADF